MRWKHILKRKLIVIVFALQALLGLSNAVYAEPTLEETRKLLEKGLTLYELDREISRLAEQEQQIAVDMQSTEQQIEHQRTQLDHSREHAGNVIKAYYMGERQSLWLLLLNVRSLSEALYVLEVLNHLLDRDKQAIATFTEERTQLEQLHQQLNQQQTQLSLVKSAFIAQREQSVKLKQEVEATLAANPEAEAILRQIEALQSSWETSGLPLFTTYFTALSEASFQLPKLFMKKENVTISGNQYTVHISDHELNEFLLSQNKIFQNFSFQFTENQVTVNGKHDNVVVVMKGRFSLEDKPQHAIRFLIDELNYNGLRLPETTVKSLERDHVLAIYPQNLAVFLRATDVQTNHNRLTVTMRINLGQN